MATANGCPDGDCTADEHATLGVDAVPLDRFADMESREGERIVFEETAEDAWIQSDLYVPRATMR